MHEFLAQLAETRDSPFADALPRENVDFDFRLVEPASMSGLVVNGEPIPDVAADFLVEQVRERLYAAKASFG